MRQFIVVGIFLCLFCAAPPLSGQFVDEKKPESDRPNPFLRGDPYEQLDLLGKYYQDIFLQQGKPGSFRFGPDFSGDLSKLFEQTTPGLGLEGRIDPAEYIVGPLDLLAIYVWGVVPFNYIGPVTPEGALIIPTIGAIDVAGEALANAKIKIQQALRKKFETGDITVSLWSLRQFRVTVAGVVKSPGSYIATPIDRVDRLVYLANLTTSGPEISPPIKQERASPLHPVDENQNLQISLRNIKLIRANGDTMAVDLVRYYATGDARCNPYVLDKDVIWVPAENLAGNSVSVYGGVRVPGRFEFHDGDSLRALLQIAQGPTALADLSDVEIARFLPDGQQVQILHFNLQAPHNGHVQDITLQKNDRIFVRERHKLRRERTVFVKGEVWRPGAYALTHHGTTLSEIIERAGGFTPEASIAEAKIIRTYENPDSLLANPDYARLVEVRLTDLNLEGREYFNYEAAIKRGFVAVDFVKLFNHQEKSADITLVEGDEIYVPSLRQTVYVYGQVNNPGYVTYVEGMNHRYYLQKAGGFGKKADRDKIRVLKRGSKAWLKPEGASIEPGDEIFVSRVARRSLAYYFNFGRDILQTATGLATVVLLIIQIQK